MTTVFTDKDLDEFISIWKEEFGEGIDRDRALAEAENLLAVVYQLRTIYRRSQKRTANKTENGG